MPSWFDLSASRSLFNLLVEYNVQEAVCQEQNERMMFDLPPESFFQ